MQKVSLRATIAGRVFELDSEQLAAALEGVEPEPLRDHFVVVAGRRYPPKQALAVLTGLDRGDFTTYQARSVLQRLGCTPGRVGASETGRVPTREGLSAAEQRLAEELRPHRGRFVALRGARVLHAADRPDEVLSWLSRHGSRADSLFRVPLDPAVDLGGFHG